MKKILKVILIFTLLFFSFVFVSYASDKVNIAIEKAYNKFILKVEKKYSSEKQLKFLITLWNKLDLILEKKKLSTEKKVLIKDLLKLNNEKVFNLKLKNKKDDILKKMNSFSVYKIFPKKILNDESIFLEDWVWYTYIYSWYTFFPKWTNIKSYHIEQNNIDTNNTLLKLLDDGNIWFIVNYKKIKLISDDIIFWVPDKYNFLSELKKDKRFLITDTDELFKDLKKDTLEITKDLKQKDKIKNIYKFILENVKYTDNLSLEDKRIFSWILTYKNNDWVCEWYARLMIYMLHFSWIRESKLLTWDVIDAPDFPEIWHAWVSIWNNYYDPTFDDPIWIDKTKSFDEYKYYNLPRDLFYTNRYDYLKTPVDLETTWLDYRKKLISKNLSDLVSKYENKDFILLKLYKFKKSIWLNYYSKITIKDIEDHVRFYEVNSDFSFIKDWKKGYVKSIKFYQVDDSTIESTLEQINYNLSYYYLFKWYKNWNSWDYEYRLANESSLEFR